MCAQCDTAKRQRIEYQSIDLLETFLRHPLSSSYKHPVAFGTQECKNSSDTNSAKQLRHPDATLISNEENGLNIVIEIDENSHTDRPIECELAKLCDQTSAIKKLNGSESVVWTIRVNPTLSAKDTTPLEDRMKRVADRVNWLLQLDLNELKRDFGKRVHLPIVEYHYYRRKNKHVQAALAATDAVAVIGW